MAGYLESSHVRLMLQDWKCLYDSLCRVRNSQQLRNGALCLGDEVIKGFQQCKQKLEDST
jgi:hypothetical protein